MPDMFGVSGSGTAACGVVSALWPTRSAICEVSRAKSASAGMPLVFNQGNELLPLLIMCIQNAQTLTGNLKGQQGEKGLRLWCISQVRRLNHLEERLLDQA